MTELERTAIILKLEHALKQSNAKVVNEVPRDVMLALFNSNTQLSQLRAELDEARRRVGELPVVVRMPGHSQIIARFRSWDDARMVFKSLNETSPNAGNFGWVINNESAATAGEGERGPPDPPGWEGGFADNH